ncbi:hypothetical protein D4R71_05250 [bacterium]|nr:MAG: hypothetical protein D4R71_05250 [bacterium]
MIPPFLGREFGFIIFGVKDKLMEDGIIYIFILINKSTEKNFFFFLLLTLPKLCSGDVTQDSDLSRRLAGA